MATIFCIEGCHGIGKSSTVEKLRKNKYKCIDEDFMEYNNTNLHPQHLMLESRWALNWFYEAIKLSKKHNIIISDRSPYTSVFYSRKNGYIIKPLIDEIVLQIENEENIKLVILCLQTNDKDKLWVEVKERLTREPEREKYGEGNKEWFEKIYNLYEYNTKNLNWISIKENYFSEIEKTIKKYKIKK
jgi:thymidylate kinase